MRIMDTLKQRVDVFAGDHIDDGRVVDYFLKYCDLECGWWMDEEHDEESLKNALKSFVTENPSLAEKISLD